MAKRKSNPKTTIPTKDKAHRAIDGLNMPFEKAMAFLAQQPDKKDDQDKKSK